MKATENFDETRGFKFISYAVWWIRQSILRALAEQTSIVRLPLNRFGAKVKVANTLHRLEQKFERKPTDEEIAEELNMLPSDVIQAIKNNSKDVSLDFTLFNEGGEDPQNTHDAYDVLEDKDSVKPDQSLMTEALRTEIERSLCKLTTKQQDVLRLVFGLNEKREGIPLDEVGKKLDLTRERVRQIKNKAISRLRKGSGSKLLKQYLGSA